jgi:hypothetical protein
VLARVIGLVLAIVMMTGAAVQVCASPGASSAAACAIDDDPPALDPAVLPSVVAVPLPDRRVPAASCAPHQDAPGRLHAVFVFRPPRPIASR